MLSLILSLIVALFLNSVIVKSVYKGKKTFFWEISKTIDLSPAKLLTIVGIIIFSYLFKTFLMDNFVVDNYKSQQKEPTSVTLTIQQLDSIKNSVRDSLNERKENNYRESKYYSPPKNKDEVCATARVVHRGSGNVVRIQNSVNKNTQQNYESTEDVYKDFEKETEARTKAASGN